MGTTVNNNIFSIMALSALMYATSWIKHTRAKHIA